ncbi:MAG: hypothetical protein ACTHZ5_12750 [Micrococcaceae bacterium]
MIQGEQFPLLGFDALDRWDNQWRISNPSIVEVSRDDDGRLALQKLEKHPMHLLLRAKVSDLKKLGGNRGVALEDDRAYQVGLTAEIGGRLVAQLVLHEFDAEGVLLTRSPIEAGQRVLYVAHPDAQRLVITIRLTGTGRVIVHRVEILPVDGVRSAEPGVHPIEEFEGPLEVRHVQTFDELKDFWLQNEELYQRIAEATSHSVADGLDELRAENRDLRAQLETLAAATRDLQRSLNQVKSHLAHADLRQSLADMPNVAVEPRSIAARTHQEGRR